VTGSPAAHFTSSSAPGYFSCWAARRAGGGGEGVQTQPQLAPLDHVEKSCPTKAEKARKSQVDRCSVSDDA
jgi:hypothetical protein